MAARKTAKAAPNLHIITTCPECGQPIRAPATETGKVLRRYAERRGVSQSELARAVGVAPQAINFLFLGRQGDNAYLGTRAPRKGVTPLVFRVRDELKIPEKVLSEALLADIIRLGKGCSTKELHDLQKQLRRTRRSVVEHPQRVLAVG
jgi:transcriptional regulator with XRE-family HTH domain